jgi:hypothetical protein
MIITPKIIKKNIITFLRFQSDNYSIYYKSRYSFTFVELIRIKSLNPVPYRDIPPFIILENY